MAHFAELDQENTVVRVVVVSNDDIVDQNGTEQEQLGVDLCNEHIGTGVWVQTSYNDNFRKMFGQPGFKYVNDADLFYNPVSPFPSWELDENYDWQAPVPMPDDGQDYCWDEESVSWQPIPPMVYAQPTE